MNKCAQLLPGIALISGNRRALLSSLLAGAIFRRTKRQGDESLAPAVLQRSRRRRQALAWLLGVIASLGLVSAAADEASYRPDTQRDVEEVARLKANPVRGAELFSYCAPCHGTQANGLPEGWAPQITGQHPRYLTKELLDYRRSVRWDARMQPIAKGHALRGMQDIADVVSFLAAQAPMGDGTADNAPAGPEVKQFYRAQCSRCHGRSGSGDNLRIVPRIAGQDFAYLLRQMHDVVDGRRPNMRRQHFKALADLDVQELVRLARYVSHLSTNDESGSGELTTTDGMWPEVRMAAREW